MQTKINLTIIIFSLFFGANSQENTYIFGSFESNSQYLQNDDDLNFYSPSDNFRSNNYFQIEFQNGDFSYGIQYESYLPSALLGYSDIFNNNDGIAQYYFKYENKKNEITVGSFYEQFGNGLVFRSWEDRQLGINNSIRGLRYKFFPSNNFEISAIHGKQRNGFQYSSSVITGINSELNLSEFLNSKNVDIVFGVSLVNRYQNINSGFNIPENVTVSGARFDLFYK